MPALVLFGRRWQCATDDFVIPGIIGLVLRSLWCAAYAVILSVVKFDDGCEDGHLFFRIYLSGAVGVYGVSMLLDMALIHHSRKGSIMQTRLRHHVPSILYCAVVLYLLEILWACLGTYWVFARGFECDSIHSTPLRALKGTVISNWIFIGSYLIVTYFFFDPIGGKATTHDKLMEFRQGEEYHRVWEENCRSCCMCAGVGKESRLVYAEVSNIFADFFKNLDIVPSDFIAGLILLRQAQKHDEQLRASVATTSSGRFHQSTENAKALDTKDSVEALDLLEIDYFAKYALAVYGWPLFVFMHPCTGVPRLNVCDCRCCTGGCCGTSAVPISGDNCCLCNLDALKKQSGLGDADIVYASFLNGLYQTPYYVGVDHARRTVVIAVRGTMSLADCLTDLTAYETPIEIPGVSEPCYAHKGMLQAAQRIKQDLEDRRVLSDLYREGSPCAGYGLVVVGHSLGAGTGTLLALLLRSEFTGLFCYAYSPPGCLLNAAAAKYAEQFCISLVVGKDVVPRMSFHSAEGMRDDMMEALAISPRPKWKVIAGNFIVGHPKETTDYAAVNTEDPELARESEPIATLQRYKALRAQEPRRERMYMPGRILHLVKTDSSRRLPFGRRRSYRAEWADREGFSKIIISPLMIGDHFPDTVKDVLELVVQNVGGGTVGTSTLHAKAHVPSQSLPPVVAQTSFGITEQPRRSVRAASSSSSGPNKQDELRQPLMADGKAPLADTEVWKN